MPWGWLASISGSLSGAGVGIAVLLLATALWEQSRPERVSAAGAGQRWLANFSLYGLNEGAKLWLAPVLLAITGPWPYHVPLPAATGLRYLILLPAFDLAVYLLHRLFHAFDWMWRLHAIHHTDIDLDVSTTVRHHPFEAILMGFALVTVAGALGATAGELAVYTMIAFAVQLVAHANVTLPSWLGGALERIIVTPGFHRLHHACDPRLHNANYGEVLAVWDRLFATAIMSRAATVDPVPFGVAAYLAPRFRSLGWILAQPFLPRPAETTLKVLAAD